MSIRHSRAFAALVISATGLAIAGGVANATTPVDSAPADPAPAGSAAGVAAAPLRILLTNDDGWDAPGITAVYTALVAAGHEVVLVGPGENQSGTGARITFGAPLTLTQHAAGVFSVTGTPADATEVGLSIAFGGELPDLVVSGSNSGQNIANASVHSGTIGAAVTALNEGVPAIAVSNELGEGGASDFDGAAALTVELIAALAGASGGGPLLPDGIGLNVNFPNIEEGSELAGVAVTTTDRSFLDVDYAEAAVPEVGASSEISAGFIIIEPVDPTADTAQLAANFATVTFIAGSYDVVPPANADSIGALGEVIAAL